MPEFIWPWPKGTRASQEFGTNPGGVNPIGGHTGLDAALPAGTPLRAEADGIVTFEGWATLGNNPYLLTDGGGICLAIDFGKDRPASIKGHLSTTFVSYGDRVKQGQIVCESGNTGKWTTGPHVHEEFLPPVYDMQRSTTYGRVNPRNYCSAYWEDLQAPPILLPLPHQRETMTKVWERIVADHTSELTKVKLWDEELIFDFKGYVLGSDPFGDGNRVWFKSAHRDTYYHSSGFKDQGTHDLPNLTTGGTVPQPTPEPVPDYGQTLHGVDISGHQGDIDIMAVSAHFIGIKATEGVGWVDPKLDRNARLTPHITRIFYHWARPDLGNTAEEELEFCLDTLRPYLRVGDIIALDWEDDRIDLGDVGWAQTWLDGADDTLGGTSILYAPGRALDAAGPRWEPVEARHPLWYPDYNQGQQINGFHPEQAGARPPVVWNGKPMLIWQYSSKGRLPGYAGDLDLNVFYGSPADLAAVSITRLAQAPQPEPEPTPTPEPKAPPTADQPISALVDYYKEQTQ